MIARLLLVLTLCGILCGLGVWQVQRNAWKQDLLSRIDAAESNPSPPPLFSLATLRAADHDDPTWSRMRLGSDLRRSHAFVIGPTSESGKPGFRAYALYDLPQSDVSLLVAGPFLQGTDRQEATQAAGAAMPDQGDNRAGLLLPPPRVGWFSLPNDPASGKWGHVDREALSLWSRRTLFPAMLWTDGPVARPPANHRLYAAFWFAMAAVTALMGGLWLRSTATPSDR